MSHSTHVNWRLEHYEDLDSTGTPDNVIKQFSNPQVITSTGDGRDSFQFTLKSSVDVADKINMQDKVLIKRKINSSQFGADDVVMNAATNKVPREDQTGKSTFKVKGNNYSKTLMDATVFVDASNEPVDEAIKLALNSIKNYAPEFGVDWNSNNPTDKTDGTSFPDIGEKWYDIPMRKVMERVSQDKYTEDGDYYWYVDSNNELVWRPEGDNVIDTITSSLPYKTASLKRDTEDVVNFVKVKGGTLPTGGAVEAQAIDFGSAGKNGLRYKAIQGNENYVDNLHTETMVDIGGNENNIRPSEVSGFSYPLSVGPVAENTDSSIDNDTEYFQALKSVAKDRLRRDGNDFIDNNKNGYFELELEISPNANIFQLGELFDNKIPQFPQKPFRVREIQYTSTIDVIRLREDEPSVGA